MNNVREKGKIRCKLSYRVFKEEYGYYTLLGIYPYPAVIQLKEFLRGIHHCVTVVGRWIFDSNFPFVLPITQEIWTTIALITIEDKE